ncbi:MAG: hypothetical protein K6G25_11335 [Bacteroidales bacterium]|nr:hypothetical protein [Bacteroidales bacterium]
MSTATLTNLLEYLYGTLTPNNMKWLGEHLIEHAEKMEDPLQPYTMEEIDAMLEESERDFEAGRCYSTDEVLKMCEESLLQMKTV